MVRQFETSFLSPLNLFFTMTHLRILAGTALLANFIIAVGNATPAHTLGVFEVDLIFPRNETSTLRPWTDSSAN
ncbi:hypothetical protein BDV24DRAFT_128182 [Aspergillus arachidicola]|uniref:Uncharacterized protein n=1 Tax=Aspergillus arachidicola TaxID=656916 RepID=A0A5N6YFT3_9EURO|nr:hypothetical protein BDV24DRAFT_128182 [Aspergillus arachidicola]